MTHEEKLAAIPHIVHDWRNLVAGGKMTGRDQPYPLNHFIQHAFLLECRKFGAFFQNNRGGRGHKDFVAKEFTVKRFKAKLPVWKQWETHMDKHLMHLSHERITNNVPWDGRLVNESLLIEFQTAWIEFLSCVDLKYHETFRRS